MIISGSKDRKVQLHPDHPDGYIISERVRIGPRRFDEARVFVSVEEIRKIVLKLRQEGVSL